MKTYNVTFLIIVFAALLGASACSVNRHTIGNGPVGDAPSKLVRTTKQLYLFAGLIPVNKPKSNPPKATPDYQIKTSKRPSDFLIGIATFNLLTSRTVQVYVHKDPKKAKTTASNTTPAATSTSSDSTNTAKEKISNKQ